MNGMLTLLDFCGGALPEWEPTVIPRFLKTTALLANSAGLRLSRGRGYHQKNSPISFERKGDSTMNSLVLFNNTVKEAEIADHQSNQVPAPAPKPKVLPKKEIPRLPRTQIEPKRLPVPSGKVPGADDKS